MKWFIILMLVILPVIAFAEDEVAPVIDPADTGMPAVESPTDQPAQEPARDGDQARPVDAAGKAPVPRVDKNDGSGVRFQSIEDLNKVGR